MVHNAFDVGWDRVDWARSNKEIAAELHLHPGSVSLMRAKLRRKGRDIPRSPMPEGFAAKAGAGWVAQTRRQWTKLLRRARPLLQKGLAPKEVARHLGIDPKRLLRALAWAEDASRARDVAHGARARDAAGRLL